MATWGGCSSITFTGGTFGPTSNTSNDYGLDTQQDTSTARFFELRYNGQFVSQGANGPRKGIEFRLETNGDTVIYLESSNNDLTPYSFDSSSIVNSKVIKSSTVDLSGQGISLYNGSTADIVFNITTDMFWTASSGGSGPSVTSINQDTIIVPTDTVTVTDFTLLKDGTSYTPTTSNLNLTGPTVADGTRLYNYSLTLDGSGAYSRTIDNKSFTAFHYDGSWESNTSGPASGRGTNSTTVLNVLGAIPPSTVMDFGNNGSGWSIDIRTTRHLLYRETLSGSGNYNIFGIYIQGTSDDVEAVLYYRQERSYVVINSYKETYSIGKQETMTLSPSTAGNTFTVSVDDWVYFTDLGVAYDHGLDHVSAYTAKGCSRNFW